MEYKIFVNLTNEEVKIEELGMDLIQESIENFNKDSAKLKNPKQIINHSIKNNSMELLLNSEGEITNIEKGINKLLTLITKKLQKANKDLFNKVNITGNIFTISQEEIIEKEEIKKDIEDENVIETKIDNIDSNFEQKINLSLNVDFDIDKNETFKRIVNDGVKYFNDISLKTELQKQISECEIDKNILKITLKSALDFSVSAKSLRSFILFILRSLQKEDEELLNKIVVKNSLFKRVD